MAVAETIGCSPGCYKNSVANNIPLLGIQRLGSMALNGNASQGGLDSAVFYVGGSAIAVTGQDILGLANSWQDAEFNVFGDCCSSQATFNPGSVIVVRTSINSGAATAPACESGFTAETNNLYFKAATVPPSSGVLPAIVSLNLRMLV